MSKPQPLETFHAEDEVQALQSELLAWRRQLSLGTVKGEDINIFIIKLARQRAAREPSDPFVFDRVRSHLLNGRITPTDVMRQL